MLTNQSCPVAGPGLRPLPANHGELEAVIRRLDHAIGDFGSADHAIFLTAAMSCLRQEGRSRCACATSTGRRASSASIATTSASTAARRRASGVQVCAVGRSRRGRVRDETRTVAVSARVRRSATPPASA